MKKMLFDLFTAAFCLPNPRVELSSRLVPRDPPAQLPNEVHDDDDERATRPVVIDLGQPLDDALANVVCL